MMKHKRRARSRGKAWSWKKGALVVTALAATSTFIVNTGRMVGYVFDKMMPKNAPVTYAQILPSESMQVRDSVTVTVHRKR
jgi:hypothetical protein